MKHTMGLWIGLALVLTACAPVSVAPTSPPTDKLAEIMARGTLVIATDADYEPQSKLLKGVLPVGETKCELSQYTANQLTGFDVDVAIEIAHRMGLEPCFVTPPWSQLVSGNWGDNWDIHVGSVAITYERMKALYFSQPYYATPTVILVHKDNTVFQNPEDLSGKRIAVCVGCTFESYLKGTLHIPGQKIEYRVHDPLIDAYENEEPAINDLSLGDGVKLDALLTILPVAKKTIASGKPLKIMGDPLFYTFASVTMDRSSRRDNTRLLDDVSKIIRDMHKDGTLKRLSIKYQGQDLTSEAALFDLLSIDQLP